MATGVGVKAHSVGETKKSLKQRESPEHCYKPAHILKARQALTSLPRGAEAVSSSFSDTTSLSSSFDFTVTRN